MWIHCRTSSLKNTGGKSDREWFAHLRAQPKETAITRRPFQEQRSWQVPFPPPTPQHKQWPPVRSSIELTLLTCLHKAPPCHATPTHFSEHTPFQSLLPQSHCSSPFPQKTSTNPTNTPSLDLRFCRTSVPTWVSLHSQANHYTPCCPQQAEKASANNWRKKRLRFNSRAYITHIGVPEAPGPRE